jgi:Tfp pilus assembly protein PilO
MLRLRRQSAGFVFAQYFLGALILFALAGYYVMIYRPLMDENNELRMQLTDRQTPPPSQANATTAPSLELQTLRDRLAKLGSVPSEPRLDEFLTEVHGLSLRWGLRGLTMEEAAVRHRQGYVEQPISLAFQGDYQDVYSFLVRLENLSRLVRVVNLAIHSTDEKQGLVSVSMDVNIYYTEEP